MDSFILGLLNMIWPWINLFLIAIGGAVIVCVVLLIRWLRRKGK